MAGRLTATTRAGATVSAYEPLEVATVERYLDGRPAWRSLLPRGPLAVTEVGDGNLNLVFIVRSEAEPERAGLVLKQSLPWVRVFGAGWPLTVERAAHEAHAYARYSAFEHETLPAYHGFDAEQYVLAIEDLSGLRVWRAALNDGEIHAGAAAAIGRFVARLAFWTSDVGRRPRSASGSRPRRSTPSCAASPRTSSSPSHTSSTSTTTTCRRSTRWCRRSGPTPASGKRSASSSTRS